MEKRLSNLISAYQAAVATATSLMVRSGISLPSSNDDWATSDIPYKGYLLGEVPYFKHGYGCAVHLPSGAVDFDFGAKGEVNGFDLWRLASFAEDRLNEFGFKTEDELESSFNAAAEANELIYSGYILYYLAGPAG